MGRRSISGLSGDAIQAWPTACYRRGATDRNHHVKCEKYVEQRPESFVIDGFTEDIVCLIYVPREAVCSDVERSTPEILE